MSRKVNLPHLELLEGQQIPFLNNCLQSPKIAYRIPPYLAERADVLSIPGCLLDMLLV